MLENMMGKQIHRYQLSQEVAKGNEALVFLNVIEIGTENEKTILPFINEMLIDAGCIEGEFTMHHTIRRDYQNDFIVFFDQPNVKVNIGKLSLWRINAGQAFDAKWASDYLVNQMPEVY